MNTNNWNFSSKDIPGKLFIVVTEKIWNSALPEVETTDLEAPYFTTGPVVREFRSDSNNMVIIFTAFFKFPTIFSVCIVASYWLHQLCPKFHSLTHISLPHYSIPSFAFKEPSSLWNASQSLLQCLFFTSKTVFFVMVRCCLPKRDSVTAKAPYYYSKNPLHVRIALLRKWEYRYRRKSYFYNWSEK